MKTISVAAHFSKFPAGRFTSDGPHSGERFREVLSASLDLHDVIVDLDGTMGYGSSFLEEAFGGLVTKCGFTPEALRKKMKIESEDPSLAKEVWSYIDSSETIEKSTTWTLQDSNIHRLGLRVAKKLEHHFDAYESNPSTYRFIMSTFFQLLWIPGGVGILGILLACEETEPWYLRFLGGLVTLLMLPFMLLTVIGLFISEGIDRVKELRANQHAK